jgi:hypothetical protein
MFKIKNLPIIFLAFLMLILLFFEIWTYYLGTTDVTFKRLLKHEPYKEISDLSLRRYKENAISPHLFTITTNDEKSVIKKLKSDCRIKKRDIKSVPKIIKDIDKEMIDVIKRSPYIYLSNSYDLKNPKEGRMCLLFRDKDHLYLFINGNL